MVKTITLIKIPTKLLKMVQASSLSFWIRWGFWQTYVVGKNLTFIFAKTAMAVYPGVDFNTASKWKTAYLGMLEEEMKSRSNFVEVVYFDLNRPAEKDCDFSISNPKPLPKIMGMINDGTVVMKYGLIPITL